MHACTIKSVTIKSKIFTLKNRPLQLFIFFKLHLVDNILNETRVQLFLCCPLEGFLVL